MNPRLRLVLLLALWASAIVGLARAMRITAQRQGSSTRPFAVVASRYRFEPARIEVNEGDLVTD